MQIQFSQSIGKFLFLFFLVSSCSYDVSDQRVNGFEVLRMDNDVMEEMVRKNSFGSHSPIPADRLKLLKVKHYDFDGREHEGEIMVLDACSEQVLSIFQQLYSLKFAIERIKLITEYIGDDSLSMADNNTSAHNLRPVTGGKRFSLHAYGTAIDLNPVQNPFVDISCDDSLGIALFRPVEGIRFANRREDRLGKENRQGMAEEVIEVFASHGFYWWGGDWNCPIDYQHFQVSRSITEVLVAMKPEQAEQFFNAVVSYFNKHQQPIEYELAGRIGDEFSFETFYKANPEKFMEIIDQLD